MEAVEAKSQQDVDVTHVDQLSPESQKVIYQILADVVTRMRKNGEEI